MLDKKPATKKLMFSAGCMVSLYIKKQVCARAVLKAGNICILSRFWHCSVGEGLLCYNPWDMDFKYLLGGLFFKIYFKAGKEIIVWLCGASTQMIEPRSCCSGTNGFVGWISLIVIVIVLLSSPAPGSAGPCGHVSVVCTAGKWLDYQGTHHSHWKWQGRRRNPLSSSK